MSPKTAGDRAAARWSTASPAPLEFDILGPVRVRRGGQELDLGPAKQRAVLAVLLLEANRPVPADRIVAAVWGGEPPANGANVVQKYVAGLRRVLEPDRSPRTPGRLLRLHPAGYQLTVEPGGLDVDTFTTDVQQATAAAEAGSLDEAVGLVSAALRRCRGEPLAGLSGPVFDSARNRLVERRAAALELRADLLLRCGQHADLVADLVRLVEEFPLREQLRCLYMLALYRSGRQAEALAAYADARHRLVAEFGVEPGEALRRLHTRILRSDPELTGPEPASSIPDTGAPPVAAHAGPSGGAPPAAAVSGERTAGIATGSPITGSTASDMPVAGSHATVPGEPRPAPTGPPLSGAAGAPVTELRRWRSRTARTVAVLVPLLTFGVGTWLVFGWLAGWFRQRTPAYLAAGYLAVLVVMVIGLGAADAGADAPMDVPGGAGFLAFLVGWLGGTAHLALLMFRPPRVR